MPLTTALRWAKARARARARARVRFEVTIVSPAAEAFQLLASGAFLVEQLRLGIARRVGHPPAWLRLLFGDRQLADGGTLSDYNIQEGTVITLVKLPVRLHIFVATPDGRTTPLEVRTSDTIDHIKARVSAALVGRIPPDQLRLTFAGNLLEDGRRTVSDYNIQHYNVLALSHA